MRRRSGNSFTALAATVILRPMRRYLRIFAAGLVAATIVPWAAAAEPITLNGITFSDEVGGFVLVDGWGSGTLDDPFVIVEQVTDNAPAILVVREFSAAFGNPARTQHLSGFVMTKIVINGTSSAWQSYELQLQELLGQDSTYGDGLSFGQNPSSARSFSSDLYRDMIAIDEPLDGVTFRQGVVHPGERVAFRFFVTDNTPQSLFYLVQTREQPVVMAPLRDSPPPNG